MTITTPTESLLQKLQLVYKGMKWEKDTIVFYTGINDCPRRERNRLYIVVSRCRTLPVLTDVEVAVFRSHHLEDRVHKKDMDILLRKLICTITLEDLAL
jgi:hypothetical protein